MRTLRVASLFAGCGGTDIGVEGGFTFLGQKYEKHPTRLVYANDFDEAACNIFDGNFSIKISRKDIRTVDVDEIPDHDILTAGFPCQSFSIVAQNPPRLGIKDSEKGSLFEEICRILQAKNPQGFICENVKGILSANDSKAFPVIMQSLRNCGYHVIHLLLNAYHYGVPQRRERVFIIGFKNKKTLEAFRPPMPVDKFSTLGEVIFPEKSIPDKYYFSQKAINGMLRAKKEMNKGRVQNLNGPCGTVGAHLSKISLNSTDPVLCINNRYRRFIPREVASIQSFPDSYNLLGNDAKQYRALGNAIPPVLAWHVVKAFIEATERSEKTEIYQTANESVFGNNTNGLKVTIPAPSNNDSPKTAEQLFLFDKKMLYVVQNSPVTLMGTYRRSCRDWIIKNNLYNYPVSDEELDICYELLAVRRLVLKRQNDIPLYFAVNGYSIVAKADLKKLGYVTLGTHPDNGKYILYSLSKLPEPIPIFTQDKAYIIGKGIKL